MVRLEVLVRSPFFGLPGFQFLYGAIGRRGGYNILCKFDLFQFLYGAIGRRYFKSIYNRYRCFNSYMVRLEEELGRIGLRGFYVSIPIWCDWKSQ